MWCGACNLIWSLWIFAVHSALGFRFAGRIVHCMGLLRFAVLLLLNVVMFTSAGFRVVCLIGYIAALA